jgi:hypothetical protein
MAKVGNFRAPLVSPTSKWGPAIAKTQISSEYAQLQTADT